MSEDIELMSEEEIDGLWSIQQGSGYLSRDHIQSLFHAARVAHKLKQRVEELEQKHSEMKAHLIEIDQWVENW